MVASLHTTVSIESGSDDAAGLQKMADHVARQLRDLGAMTRVVLAVNGHPPGLVEGTWKGSGKLRVFEKLCWICSMKSPRSRRLRSTSTGHLPVRLTQATCLNRCNSISAFLGARCVGAGCANDPGRAWQQ